MNSPDDGRHGFPDERAARPGRDGRPPTRVPARRRVEQLDPTTAAPDKTQNRPSLPRRSAASRRRPSHPPGHRVTVNGPKQAGGRVAGAARTDPATTRMPRTAPGRAPTATAPTVAARGAMTVNRTAPSRAVTAAPTIGRVETALVRPATVIGPSSDDRPRRDADRPAYNDRPRRDSDRPAYNDRPRRDERPSGVQRPAAPGRDRPAYNDRPRRDSDRPAYNDRPRRDGDRPAYNDRPRREGERPAYNDRPRRDSDRPAYNDRPRRDATVRRTTTGRAGDDRPATATGPRTTTGRAGRVSARPTATGPPTTTGRAGTGTVRPTTTGRAGTPTARRTTTGPAGTMTNPGVPSRARWNDREPPMRRDPIVTAHIRTATAPRTTASHARRTGSDRTGHPPIVRGRSATGTAHPVAVERIGPTGPRRSVGT